MEQQQRRLERLLELGRSLVEDLDLELVLKRLLDSARELTGARYAALGILDERREALEQFITVGIDAPTHREIGDLPRGRGVLGVLIQNPEPLRLRDVGQHPRSYGFPHGHPPMHSFLGVPIRVNGESWGNLYLTDKEGADEFDETDEQTVIALADWAGIAITNARRHVGVRSQRDDLARAVQVFETAEAIGRALAGETELDRILELIAKRSRALVEARVLVVALREGDELVIRAASGEIDADALGFAVRLDDSISGDALRSGQPVRIAAGDSGAKAVLLRTFGARTELAVALRFRGEALGVLTAMDRLRDGPDFSADDERLMTAFATSAATAVATAHHVQAEGLRRSMRAAEQERTRWARELHDQTLQDLAGLKVMLGGARRARSREDADRILADVVDHVQLAVDQLRGLITELRPASLDELGVAPALQSLVDRVGATTGLEVEFEPKLSGARLDPEVENTIYRLVQEALSNVTKHAGAERVTIEVCEQADAVRIEVADDGAGFDVEAGSAGFGLLGMRERVALVGGTLEVRSAEGEGTTVSAGIPALRTAAPGPYHATGNY